MINVARSVNIMLQYCGPAGEEKGEDQTRREFPLKHPVNSHGQSLRFRGASTKFQSLAKFSWTCEDVESHIRFDQVCPTMEYV